MALFCDCYFFHRLNASLLRSVLGDRRGAIIGRGGCHVQWLWRRRRAVKLNSAATLSGLLAEAVAATFHCSS